MTIGRNLFIILTIIFSFLTINITYAVESNEEFATENPQSNYIKNLANLKIWQKIL